MIDTDFRVTANESGKNTVQSLKEQIQALARNEPGSLDAIEETPLEILVRTDWYTPGDDFEVSEYSVLLSTGGPASRITGRLDRGLPVSAHFEYQDWFQPWTQAELSNEEENVLLEWVSHLYFND